MTRQLNCDDVLSELDWTRCEHCKSKADFEEAIKNCCTDFGYLEYRRKLRDGLAGFVCDRDQAELLSLKRRKRWKTIYAVLDAGTMGFWGWYWAILLGLLGAAVVRALFW